MDDHDHSHCSSGCGGIMWWTTLVIAVLAVPSFGVVIAIMSGARGILALVAFVLACWLCTYIGMKLMSAPRMKRKLFRKD